MLETFVTVGLVGLFVVSSVTVFNWMTNKFGDMDDAKRRQHIDPILDAVNAVCFELLAKGSEPCGT